MITPRIIVLAALIAPLSGCDREPPLAPGPVPPWGPILPPQTPALLEPVSDTLREGGTGGYTLQVRVLDVEGKPIPNRRIAWSVVSGDASLLSADGYVSSTITSANEHGIAAVTANAFAIGSSRISAALVDTPLPAVQLRIDVVALTIYVGGDSLHTPTRDGLRARHAFEIPLGAAVLWIPDWWTALHIHVVSTSAPAPNAHFDSGIIGTAERPSFQYRPPTTGIWEFVDALSGVRGTLTVR